MSFKLFIYSLNFFSVFEVEIDLINLFCKIAKFQKEIVNPSDSASFNVANASSDYYVRRELPSNCFKWENE
jgi:hypothetical protein